MRLWAQIEGRAIVFEHTGLNIQEGIDFNAYTDRIQLPKHAEDLEMQEVPTPSQAQEAMKQDSYLYPLRCA